MTIRQQRTLQALPEHNYNLSAAMLAAGYTPATSRAGTQYKSLRRYTQDILHPDRTKRKLLKVQSKAWQKEDLPNYLRSLELEARIQGMTKESTSRDEIPQTIVILNSNIRSNPEPSDHKDEITDRC